MEPLKVNMLQCMGYFQAIYKQRLMSFVFVLFLKELISRDTPNILYFRNGFNIRRGQFFIIMLNPTVGNTTEETLASGLYTQYYLI